MDKYHEMTCPNCHKEVWELTTVKVGSTTPIFNGWIEKELCDSCIEDFFDTACESEIERNQEVYDKFNPLKKQLFEALNPGTNPFMP